jgi:hypothetical protein
MWSTTVIPSDSDDGHTQDGLGQKGTIGGIPANTEYKLKPGEYLCINYTNTSTNNGEEKKVKVNEFYSGDSDTPVIIKPNFELSDSTK